jgi:hypothetical protein
MEFGKTNNRDKWVEYYLNIPLKLQIIYKNNYDIDVPLGTFRRVLLDEWCKDSWEIHLGKPAYVYLSDGVLKRIVNKFKELIEPKIFLSKISMSNYYRLKRPETSKTIISHELIIKLKDYVRKTSIQETTNTGED